MAVSHPNRPTAIDPVKASVDWWDTCSRAAEIGWTRAVGPPAVNAAAARRVDELLRFARLQSPFYEQHWRSMKSSDEAEFSSRQRPVLCFLATALEPVSARQLCEWTGLAPGAVRDVIRQWREFLNEEPGTPPTYRIYHRSFGEFLDAEEELGWYQDQICDAGLAQIPGFYHAEPSAPVRRRRP